MNFFDQLRARRAALQRPLPVVAQYVAMERSNLYRLLAGSRDAKASTLSGLAAALDAEWVLVPKHLLPDVERLLSGQTLAPDNVVSSVQRLLGDDK
jgi:hypothetical protein